jgi:hypothetical protein
MQQVLTYSFLLPDSFEFIILLFGIESVDMVCPFYWILTRCG